MINAQTFVYNYNVNEYETNSSEKKNQQQFHVKGSPRMLIFFLYIYLSFDPQTVIG